MEHIGIRERGQWIEGVARLKDSYWGRETGSCVKALEKEANN